MSSGTRVTASQWGATKKYPQRGISNCSALEPSWVIWLWLLWRPIPTRLMQRPINWFGSNQLLPLMQCLVTLFKESLLKTYKLGEFSKFFILTIMYSRKSRFWSTFSLIQHTRILKWLWEKKIENFTYFFKMVSFQQAIIFTRCKHEWRIHTVAHMTHHHHQSPFSN